MSINLRYVEFLTFTWEKILILGIWKMVIRNSYCATFQGSCWFCNTGHRRGKHQSTIRMSFTWYKTFNLALHLLICKGTLSSPSHLFSSFVSFFLYLQKITVRVFIHINYWRGNSRCEHFFLLYFGGGVWIQKNIKLS